uniref:Uncharacterized protein n=1 Tax=viral metagenome TaxID=1070528 RepID=A0A6H1ZKR0_9ZZZZ
MSPTREQLQSNITALEKQGAKPVDIQSYLDSFKGQQPSSAPSNMGKPALAPTEKGDGFFKSLIKAPLESLLVKPVVRTAQAIEGVGREVLGLGSEEGRRAYEERISKDIKVPIPLLGDINVEAVKPGMSGIKQALGEGLEAGSYFVGGGGAAAIGKGAIKSTLGRAAIQGVKVGAKSGTLFGMGQSLQEDKDLGGVIGGGLTGAAVGGVAGGALAGAGQKIISKIASSAKKKATELSLLKGELPGPPGLPSGPLPDARIATKKLSESGKVVTDKVGKEAVRQGIPEVDVALIKTSSAVDKSKMAKMLDVRQSQLANKRITDRATDVVGDTFVNSVAKPIEKLNKEAGQKLEMVARRLAGKKIDPSPAVTDFAGSLEGAGITVRKNGTLNFKNSNFEGLKGSQQLITNVWNRALRVAKTGDALQLHRTKSYIDEIVNYGKQAEGLSGKAQAMLKQFRHNIDGILDSRFPIYNKVNTQFADTIQQLNNMGAAIGKTFKLGDTFADARSGLAMRRILSNTQSRSEILKLLDGMQQVAQKYGVKINEDIITQANFADVLEKMLGTEAPTSFLGQTGRAVSNLGQVGMDVSRGTPSGLISGTIKAGKYVIDITRGITQENKINALRALLRTESNKASNFGVKR